MSFLIKRYNLENSKLSMHNQFQMAFVSLPEQLLPKNPA